MRAGLHHLEERVSRGHGPDSRRHGAAFRECARTGHRGVQPLLGVDLHLAAHARGRAVLAQAAGPVVPGAPRVSRAQPEPVRRPHLLHVPVRADGAGRPHRATQVHPGADGARRAGDTSVNLQGAVQRAGRHRLQHRRRAAVPDVTFFDQGGRGRDGRLRRRTAPRAGVPEGSARGRRARSRRRRDDAGRRAAARLPAASRAEGRALQAPPPAPRADRFVWRPHRSRQGLRGAD